MAVSEALERKLSTILSADVAEYSRLMAEDEEQTLRTFRAHKEVFESLVALHRGRIFNTAGDAILAEFGNAVEAVRCATEIQAALRTRNEQLPALRQVRFRIGVNVGDVMVHGGDLLGDGVNVAARLQGAADPGGVCTSGSVYNQIRNKLSLGFRSLGEQGFKNIPQPVRTFSIAESAEHGPLPARKAGATGFGTAAKIAAALTGLLLAVGIGYWLLSTGPSSSGAGDIYAGPICFSPSPNDPARCFPAQAFLSGGKLSGQRPARIPGATMHIRGEVAASGAAEIEIHIDQADGARVVTMRLSGTLRDGQLDAAGAFVGTGRSVKLNWRRQ